MIFTDENLKHCLAARQDAFQAFNARWGRKGFRTISLALSGSAAQPCHTAVMVRYPRPFRGQSGLRHSQASLLDEIARLARDNLHPYIVTATGVTVADAVYAACFREMAKPPRFDLSLTAEEYLAQCDAHRQAGRILLWADAFGTPDTIRYCAIWGSNTAKVAWNAEAVNDKGDRRQQRYDALVSIGARPTRVAIAPGGGLVRLFEDTRLDGWDSRADMSPERMDEVVRENAAKGLHPVCIGAMGEGPLARFSAIFAKSDEIKPRRFRVRGRDPIGLGRTDRDLAARLDTWMEKYLKTRQLRGAALAVIEDRRLVYAKGYTWAEDDYPDIEPTTLFRMASTSKTFGAVTVWTLLARSARWNRKSFMQDIINLRAPEEPPSTWARFGQIRVRHLLESRSGIDQMSVRDAVSHRIEESGDPPPRQPLTLGEIATMIAAKEMPGTPGTTVSYGRTDYILLGLVAAAIEGVAGFDAALKRAVLVPLGMERTKGSRSLIEDQPDGHALQHTLALQTAKSAIHQNRRLVPIQYGHENYEVYEGAGGVSAAIVDLARLCALFSCRGGSNPLMSDATLVEMLEAAAETDANTSGSHGFYGFDWAKRRPNDHFAIEKRGTNPAVRAGFTGRTGQRMYAIAINGEAWPLAPEMKWTDEIPTLADAVNWGSGDLFPEYGMAPL